MRWTIARKIIIGFGLGWLALVGVGAVAYRTTINLITQVAQARHTQEVRNSLGNLFTHLVDAEAGQRS